METLFSGHLVGEMEKKFAIETLYCEKFIRSHEIPLNKGFTVACLFIGYFVCLLANSCKEYDIGMLIKLKLYVSFIETPMTSLCTYIYILFPNI